MGAGAILTWCQRTPKNGVNDKKEEFNEFVMQLQKERDGGRIIGEDIVSMIKNKYNESYSVSGVYKLLKRMNMSWVSGRSVHTKSDPEVQEAFKKTF